MIKEACISCGRTDKPLEPIPGAFMPEDYKVCCDCALKFKGKTGLPAEADRLMTEWKFEPSYSCVQCGAPVLEVSTGEVALYCQECFHTIFKVYKGFTQ